MVCIITLQVCRCTLKFSFLQHCNLVFSILKCCHLLCLTIKILQTPLGSAPPSLSLWATLELFHQYVFLMIADSPGQCPSQHPQCDACHCPCGLLPWQCPPADTAAPSEPAGQSEVLQCVSRPQLCPPHLSQHWQSLLTTEVCMCIVCVVLTCLVPQSTTTSNF